MHPLTPSKPLRAYGDRDGDGMLQMSFALQVPPSARAREAAKRFAEMHGRKEPLVATMEECAEGFTYFVVYGHSRHSIDVSQIEVPEVRAVALVYSRWRMMGVISMGMTMAIKGFFDGIGRTKVHLVAALVMNAFNVVLCYAFIFGHWGAPRMGGAGAGVSGFVATGVGLLIMVIYAAPKAVRQTLDLLRLREALKVVDDEAAAHAMIAAQAQGAGAK